MLSMYSRTIEELQSDIGKKLVIDIRPAGEYDRDHYPGCVNMPWTGNDAFLDEYGDSLPKDAPSRVPNAPKSKLLSADLLKKIR